MATPSVISATQVNANAASGTASVTVPTGCTAAVIQWAHWDNNGGSTLNLASCTLPVGASATAFTTAGTQLAEGAATDESGTGSAYVLNPDVGASKTFAWAWSAGGARAEGGKIIISWIQDANTSDFFRACANNATTATNNCNVTVASETDDLLLVMAQSYVTGDPDITGDTNIINNGTQTNEEYDLGTVTPSATSTTVEMTGEYYSTMTAITLKATVAGPAPTPHSPFGIMFYGPIQRAVMV